MPSMKKGDLSIKTAALMIGTVLILVVASSVIEGPIQNKLLEGLTTTQDSLDEFSGTVKIEDKSEDVTAQKVLSDAAKFVYQRAKGCEFVGTYPGLQGTPYTSDPKCGGFTSPNPGKFAEGSANDFEGFAGSIKFRVTSNEPVILASSGGIEGIDRSPNTWLEENMLGASQEGYSSKVLSECTEQDLEGGGGRDNIDPMQPGVGSGYSFFFNVPEPDGRAGPWMQNQGPTQEKVYCMWWSGSGTDVVTPVERAYRNQGVFVRLCKGDEGYIQVNKGDDSPHQEGEADGFDRVFSIHTYPYIEITKLGNSGGGQCGGAATDEPEIESVEAQRLGLDRRINPITLTVNIRNRRINEKSFIVYVPQSPNPETGIGEVINIDDPLQNSPEGWNSQMTGEPIPPEATESVQVETGPARRWSCDTTDGNAVVPVLVKEVGAGWIQTEKNVNSLVDKCGGSRVPDGSLNINDIGESRSHVTVTATVTNSAKAAGDFKLVVDDNTGEGPYSANIVGLQPGASQQVSVRIPKLEMLGTSSCVHDIVLKGINGNGESFELETVSDRINYADYFSSDNENLEC